MGKEWLYWGSGGSSRSTKRRISGGERDAPSGCMSAVLQLFDLHPFQFALHHQPTFKPDSFLPEEPTILKGVEAPRNSLELEDPSTGAASFSSAMKEEENLNIPRGIQIKTNGDTRSSRARPDDLASECSSSPGTKTPNLVARLMGLDLLPDTISPSFSSSNHSIPNPPSKSNLHPQVRSLKQDQFRSGALLLQGRSSSSRNFSDIDIVGTRSLPETPRISSARRSDVDHRLSLQINKENIGVSDVFEFSSYLTTKTVRRREFRQEDENRSPAGHYARQIVKQVKESVSWKVGLDITNTIKSREQGRDDHIVLLESKNPSKAFTRVADEPSPSKQSTPSCSSRLRFLEVRNKPVTTSAATKSQTSHSPKLSSSADSQSQPAKVTAKSKPHEVPLQEKKQQRQKSIKKCKKIASERYSSRLRQPPKTSDTMRNKQGEPFVRSLTTNRANQLSDKKCKKTQLSNDLLNTNVPTLLSVKKDPSTSTTKLPQNQSQASDALSSKTSTQLSSCSSHSYKQGTHTRLTVQDNNHENNPNSATNNTVDGAEFQYISAILKRTGIDRDTPVSFAKWYSPSHPLDPSIFSHLELSRIFATSSSSTVTIKNSELSQQCNRKLIFQLVDEILVELLRPWINLKPWASSNITNGHCQMYGSELIDTLCRRIGNSPSANCRVLEDVDALIDKDLRTGQLGTWAGYEEEGENIVSEIEGYIVDTLVHETAVLVFGSKARPYSVRTLF